MLPCLPLATVMAKVFWMKGLPFTHIASSKFVTKQSLALRNLHRSMIILKPSSLPSTNKPWRTALVAKRLKPALGGPRQLLKISWKISGFSCGLGAHLLDRPPPLGYQPVFGCLETSWKPKSHNGPMGKIIRVQLKLPLKMQTCPMPPFPKDFRQRTVIQKLLGEKNSFTKCLPHTSQTSKVRRRLFPNCSNSIHG